MPYGHGSSIATAVRKSRNKLLINTLDCSSCCNHTAFKWKSLSNVRVRLISSCLRGVLLQHCLDNLMVELGTTRAKHIVREVLDIGRRSQQRPRKT